MNPIINPKKTQSIKTMSIALRILLFLLYILFWISILAFCHLANINGMFYTFIDAWGQWSVYVGIIAAFLVFLSPIFFVFLRKKSLHINATLIPVLCILLTIIFIFVSLTAFFISASRFQTFTKEKWEAFPRQRYIMLHDLKENYGIVGMDSQQITELLGDPDEITPYKSWIYHCEYNFIEIAFDASSQATSIALH